MTRGTVVAGLAAMVILAAIIVARGGGSDAYVVKTVMPNANGLRVGVPVRVGGAQVGKVSSVELRGKAVEVAMTLDDKTAPVGRDASLVIESQNLLGQKAVRLVKGSSSEPAASGTPIPPARVKVSTDLDQVLSVLDGQTRARLGVLVNEAGQALLGRRADLRELVGELPRSMAGIGTLLDRLTADNHALAGAVTRSDRVIGRLTAERSALVRMIDTVGQTAKTVATERRGLGQTLDAAPATLTELRTFLTELQRLTRPLGPAAGYLTDAAPQLTKVLERVPPAAQAGIPTLRTAKTVAPDLTQLADGLTPILRRARPVTATVARLTTTMQPLGGALDHSLDNIVGILDNWSRAVQYRDGIGHIFRGEASLAPGALESMLNRLGPDTPARTASPAAKGRPSSKTPDNTGGSGSSDAAAAPRPKPGVQLPPAVGPAVGAAGKTIDDLLSKVLPPLTGTPPIGKSDEPRNDAAALLDRLLGR